MTPAEAAVLLAYCAGYDQRTIGEIDARAWAQALTGITLAEAQEAVLAHYQASTERVMVAQVRAAVVARRNDRRQRETVASITARPVMPPEQLARWNQAVTRLTRPVPGDADPAEADERWHRRHHAMTVPCPWCRAGTGQPCTVDEVPLRDRDGVHPSRVAAANGEEVHVPQQARPLREEPFWVCPGCRCAQPLDMAACVGCDPARPKGSA